MRQGHLHPSTMFLRKLVKIYEELGFEVYESPEVDSEWYNFDALNVPSDHPARDVQDTFWLKDGRVLRTQTSNGQVRFGEKNKPPFRIVIPGRCFRNEATDARHETTFYQVEGLCVDENISVANLFWTIDQMMKKLFGNSIEYRIRPHHYPFVEPGYDVDIKLNGKWMEIFGSGMVHPIVLKNMGIDSEKYSGFAFGLGPDRMMMKKFGIEDIRLNLSGDLRYLRQF